MDRLWSPWRLDYVTGKRSDVGCVFCLSDEATLPPDAGDLVVHAGTHCYVILNLFPYNNGHLMVVPRRHTAALASLHATELHELALFTQLAETAINEAYRPEGINVGINLGKSAGAGILEHLHVHLVPRWNGDTNFMTVVGATRVLPETLAASAARLRPIFARLAST